MTEEMKRGRYFCLLIFLICFFVMPLTSRADGNKTTDAPPVILPAGFIYPPEHIYDTRPHPDEALANIQIESNRWPHCHTFESTIQSIFRIEGVTAKSDEKKALALWKWFRILMSATGGKYAYEGAVSGKETLVHDGHKILTVYGHHQCDGLSWAMVPLWRAAGYIAFDEASHSHTTASLRYRDHDGLQRFHSFDPQGRFFWWNADLEVVGTRTLPLMQASVHRHLTLPQKVHSLRTSLHTNETIERKWNNIGQVVASGKQPAEIALSEYYRFDYGKTDGIYACAGTEIQTFSPDMTPESYHRDLSELSNKVLCTRSAEGVGLLHPKTAGETAEAIYRIHSPYVGVEATVEMDFRRQHADDLFKLHLSRDSKNWETLYDPSETGETSARIDLGRKQRAIGKPHIYTAYTFYLKVEMNARRAPTDAGLKRLHINVYRMLNKRTLPNLMPGENIFKVSADAIMPGKALRLMLDYDVTGKPFKEQHLISSFPYFFRINITGASPEIRDNYDHTFGLGDIRMGSIKMQLIDPKRDTTPSPSMITAALAEKQFLSSSPHPAGKRLLRRRNMKWTEKDISQTDGFFPQYKKRLAPSSDPLTRISHLKEQLRNGKDGSPETWRAAEELGNFPEAVDALLETLPEANIDLTLFICKALAQLQTPKAIDPLLNKWEKVPDGAPGTRYIPDVLAAIGDPRVVPALVAKLKQVRFDYRFHIAHALGELESPEARHALLDLSKNDPFPAVREMAKESLNRLAP